jgi:hypothetical protein
MLAVALLAASIVPRVMNAHAVVYPKVATPGAYEKYVLRVPNERDVPTTQVEIKFPAGLRVISFADVPGWTLTVLTDSAKHVSGAVWTGTLGPQRFIEFPFVGVNPAHRARLSWLAWQTYASGERVAWIGPQKSEHPASVTMVTYAGGITLGLGFILLLVALVIAIVALVRVRALQRRTERRLQLLEAERVPR